MEKRLHTGMHRLAQFIYRVDSPDIRRLFHSPRHVLDIERAVISTLAGDVFGNPVY